MHDASVNKRRNEHIHTSDIDDIELYFSDEEKEEENIRYQKYMQRMMNRTYPKSWSSLLASDLIQKATQKAVNTRSNGKMNNITRIMNMKSRNNVSYQSKQTSNVIDQISVTKLFSMIIRDPRINSQLKTNPVVFFNANYELKNKYHLWKQPKIQISHAQIDFNQPSIPIDIHLLRQFVLTRSMLCNVLSNIHFDHLIVGFWVKIAVQKDNKVQYVIAEILTVVENHIVYVVRDELTTSKVLMLRLPGVSKKECFTISFISNKHVTMPEFRRWEKNISKIVSPAMISRSFENLMHQKSLLYL